MISYFELSMRAWELDMESGIVFNIQNFSIHDGPGIRTVVFLKGCPLRCRWCGNPESQRTDIEMGWTKGKCIGCRECIKKLQTIGTSFDREGILHWNEKAPIDGADFDKVCPSKAFHVIGKEMTVDEVLHEALKDKAFFDTSGGGITLSGGEPLMQGDFAVSILEKAKEQNIHTTIETCGCVPWETFDRAASFLDYLIMDVKCFDEKKHVQNTGGSNRQILENLSRVRSKYPFLKIKVRTPVIPGVNDSEEEIGRIVDFIKTKAVEYELLKYHKLGLPKYESLGREYPMGDAELSEERFSELKRFAFERMHHEFVQGEGI